MSAPPSLLRSAPHHARKVPSVNAPRLARVLQSNVAKQGSRCLATVNQDQRILLDVGFTGSASRSSFSGPDSSDPQRKPDERTLKLGKSKYHLHPTRMPQVNVPSQLSASSKSASLRSFNPPSLKRSSRLKSHSISFPPHTHTSPLFPGASPTPPHSGPHLSHGAAFLSSEMSSWRSSPSAWSKGPGTLSPPYRLAQSN